MTPSWRHNPRRAAASIGGWLLIAVLAVAAWGALVVVGWVIGELVG